MQRARWIKRFMKPGAADFYIAETSRVKYEPGNIIFAVHDLRAHRDHGTLYVLDYPTSRGKDKQFI